MSTQTNWGNMIRNHGKPEAQGATVIIEKMPNFWNWEMVYTCNYRCTYCNYTALGWDRHDHMNVFPGMKRLTEVWTRIHKLYGDSHIELSGGECSTYPRFYEVMNMLTSMHTVTMDTNLSMDVNRFVSLVDPKRIRMSASFHPEFADFEAFLGKVVFLKEKGIDQIFVNYVAYPDFLRDMGRCKRELKAAGVSVFIQPFQGVYKKEKTYPDSYSPEEVAVIEDALNDGGTDSGVSRQRFTWPGSTMRSGTENQLKKIAEEKAAQGEPEDGKKHRTWSPFPWSFKKDDQGNVVEPRRPDDPPPAPPAPHKRAPVLCRMGQKYAKVYAQGDTFRCCAQLRDDMPAELFREKIYLGNLFFDDEIKLLDEPAWCDYEPCPCDRCMVVGEEVRWADRWYAPQQPQWR